MYPFFYLQINSFYCPSLSSVIQNTNQILKTPTHYTTAAFMTSNFKFIGNNLEFVPPLQLKQLPPCIWGTLCPFIQNFSGSPSLKTTAFLLGSHERSLMKSSGIRTGGHEGGSPSHTAPAGSVKRGVVRGVLRSLWVVLRTCVRSTLHR